MSISSLLFTSRDALISNQQQNRGDSDTSMEVLQNIEVMIDDTQGGGIGDQLSKVWFSWEDLSKKTGGIVERNALLSAVENLKENGALL
jgi:flagellar hook-associated protein FlgK